MMPRLWLDSQAATSAAVLLGLASLLFAISLYRRWQRLAHIPGPVLASLTNFWAAIKIWRGEMYHEFIQDLHARYGPVVRFGPNRVSFSQPEAVAEIYGTSHVYPKAASYGPMIVLANGQEIASIITLRDEKRVSEVKRHISAGFSHSTWLQQEDQINSTINILLEQLRSRAGTTIPLNTWLSFWSFDTLTNLAFSDTRGFLESGKDLDSIFPSSRARFAHWRTWSALPWLETLLYKNKYAQTSQKTSNPLATLAMQRIKERKSGEKNATGRDLLGRYLAASQQAPDVIAPKDVLALTISTIHAGSETTALFSSFLLTYLLKEHQVLAKLEDELQNANVAVPPAFNEIDKLPYLDAVIHEGLRLQTNPNCTERTVSPHDTDICGTIIPAGTDVSISEVLTARDKTLYGSDAETFRPERWLDVDKARKAEMNRAAFAFAYGRRVCTGQHLAMIEVKKLIASLIISFKFKPVDVGMRGYDGALRIIKLNVRLTPKN